MRKSIVAILLILFSAVDFLAHSQPVSEKTAGYKDFILDDEHIWLLTTTGKLRFGKWRSDSLASLTSTDTSVVAIGKDRKGNIVISDASHRINVFDRKNQTWLTLITCKGKLTGFVFDSHNHCFALTDQGIVDPVRQISYFPDSTYSGNESRWLKKKRWLATPAYFADSRDNLWLGLNYGEWGGDVFAFDLQKRSFLHLETDSVQMNRNPVLAFCEDPDNVYMAGGVSHMVLTHGSIVKFTNQKASPILLSKDRETPEEVTITKPDGTKKTETWTTWKGGHLIGPIAYNPSNRCLYFYSQHGIFKSTLGADLSDISQWQLILKPTLRWSSGQQYAAGPAMNVLKMQFSPDGTLFFLSEHDGLGIYDGKNLRYIK
jgi:hypothetical protein